MVSQSGQTWAMYLDIYIYIILYIYIWGLSLKVTPCITIVGAHLVPSEQALMFNWEYIDSIRVHFPASYATGMNIFRMRTETCFQDVSLQAQFFFSGTLSKNDQTCNNPGMENGSGDIIHSLGG